MQAVRRCSSKTLQASACLAALLLSACAGKSVPVLDAATPVAQTTQLSVPKAPPEIRAASASSDDQPAADSGGSDAINKDSAWCRYFDASSKARKSMLLSPTVSGSIDQDTNASARISYDLVDIARARLETKSAEASCKKYYAADRITRMLYVTPQSLTYAGNMERANYLQSQRGKLQAIAKRIRQHVQNGEMTVQLASGLNQYIKTVQSLESEARALAQQRETVTLLNAGNTLGLDQDLTDAERSLQEVDRMSRSLDALSVNVSAGINAANDPDNDDVFNRDSAYAKLTVSYRLGAIAPYRSHYEDLAAQARQEALTEAGHGSLWYTGEMAATVARVRQGLLVQRGQIVSAISEAQRNAKNFSQGYEIELYQSKYRAEIDVIKLTSDLRGISGTLADIDKVERKLTFQ